MIPIYNPISRGKQRIRQEARRQTQQEAKEMHRSMIIPRMGHFARCLQIVSDIPGVIVECGVANGHSLATLSILSNELDFSKNRPGRHVIGYDSFRGPPIGTIYPNTFNRDKSRDLKHSDTQIAKVKECMQSARVNNYYIVSGYLQDTLPKAGELLNSLYSTPEGRPIALLHLDVDHATSYECALIWLYPLVAPGGLVLFDEYYSEKWYEARLAIDSYLADKAYERIDTGYLEKLVIQRSVKEAQ